MSTLKIPNSEKQIIQSNVGDYRGNLWQTFNIDLDSSEGVIRTSKKLTRVLDSTLSEWDAGYISQALEIYDGRYYVATSGDVFDCSVNEDPTDSANWTDTGTISVEALGVETDMISFDGLLLVSLATDILSWDGSTKDDDWWTTVAGGSALTANKTHLMDVLRSGTDTLFVTDGSDVRYYNADAGATIVSLGDSLLTASCLTPTLDRMWVGTFTEVGNNATVHEIAVGNDQYNQSYDVDGRVCLTMFTHNNIPYVITEKGYIQAFDGAGFVTVAQFPWAAQSKVMEGCRSGLVQDSPTSRAIHPKGAKVSGKYVFIYVDVNDEFSPTTNLSNRGASGVWVLNLETRSLTHRYALSDSETDYGSHKVDRAGAILMTGTPETRIMVCGEVNGTKGVWMEDSTTDRQGYFTTVRHESDSTADAFEALVIKADTLDSDGTIDVKFRDSMRYGFPTQINDISWLGANQFTTTTALTDVHAGDEDGDQVEILAGLGAGRVCHIVSIDAGTTSTVTVDTDFGVLNEVSDIQISNFKKLQTQYTTDDGEYKKIGSPETSAFRQYEVVMNGDVTIREVVSKSNSKVEK